MTISDAMQMFDKYGVIVLFVLALLEAMNCPGMPAGVILPAAGILAAQTGSLYRALVIYTAMVVGAIIGCIALYGVGVLGGTALEHWLHKHSGKRAAKLEYHIERIHNGNWWTIFVCRMVPVIRTLGSLIAGISRMPMHNYVLGTVAGVALYNAIGIGLGYFAGWLFV